VFVGQWKSEDAKIIIAHESFRVKLNLARIITKELSNLEQALDRAR
jgi:hypothetical protein